MSTIGSFKVPCPSCEGMVLIKGPAFIGKKMECPLCKYPFKVEAPKTPAKSSAAAKSTSKPAPTKSAAPAKPTKKAPPPTEDDIEDVGDVEEVDDAEEPKPKPSKKQRIADAIKQAKSKGKGNLRETPDEDDDAADEKAGHDKRRKKLLIGLGLAFVGIAVLATASIMMFLRTGQTNNPPPGPPPKGPPPSFAKKDKDKDKDKTEKEKKSETPPPPVEVKGIVNITNLLPPDTEQVFRASLRQIFDESQFLRGAIFGPGAFREQEIKAKLGFSPLELDEIFIAENFSKAKTTFAILRFQKPADEKAILQAFALQPKGVAPLHYYQSAKENAWFAQLGRLAVGVPEHVRMHQIERKGPLCFRFEDPTTLVVTTETPMKELFLRKPPAEPKESYQTLNPAIREILNRVEARGENERLLWSSATDVNAARVVADSVRLGRPKTLWDLAVLLEEKSNRLTAAGSAMLQKEAKEFQYRAEFGCDKESDTADLAKDLQDRIIPKVRGFFEQFLSHPIDVAGSSASSAEPAKEQRSRLKINVEGKRVDVGVDLVLDGITISKLNPIIALWAASSRMEVDMASRAAPLYDLAAAGAQMPVKGVPNSAEPAKPLVPEGEYPPAAFPRPGAFGLAQEPQQRISWMAGLLPYLGQENLLRQINFDKSWRDPENWLAGRVRVPAFLDPRYPEPTHFAFPKGLGAAYGATHYVGIGGIGLDAADGPRDSKLSGILGYDGSASLEDVRNGRGLSNSVLVIQIPHEGIGGVSPWIAGGGATVRGVPHKDSIKPFVLGRDKNGSVITHNGKTGTYVAMADGSVRFIDASISDDVFKAMCTFKGREPIEIETPLSPKIEKK